MPRSEIMDDWPHLVWLLSCTICHNQECTCRIPEGYGE
jgi:hypothetical protein